MAKPTLSLQPSEADLAQSANYIDAAYVASARVPEGQEKSGSSARSVRPVIGAVKSPPIFDWE